MHLQLLVFLEQVFFGALQPVCELLRLLNARLQLVALRAPLYTLLLLLVMHPVARGLTLFEPSFNVAHPAHKRVSLTVVHTLTRCALATLRSAHLVDLGPQLCLALHRFLLLLAQLVFERIAVLLEQRAVDLQLVDFAV